VRQRSEIVLIEKTDSELGLEWNINMTQEDVEMITYSSFDAEIFDYTPSVNNR